ncbi:hypothetical protein M0812_00609 [Anaeramoeba flamelloides]|uniref:Homeobox domain-containing protein n=1 Tax=Anaeramoeba flamelloides TaxID=1746091 RepID=A0AAV8A1H3_9EUKA|nr:hypothetical protein M0812_00609 [Anaeramoeba flamelloides]
MTFSPRELSFYIPDLCEYDPFTDPNYNELFFDSPYLLGENEYSSQLSLHQQLHNYTASSYEPNFHSSMPLGNNPRKATSTNFSAFCYQPSNDQMGLDLRLHPWYKAKPLLSKNTTQQEIVQSQLRNQSTQQSFSNQEKRFLGHNSFGTFLTKQPALIKRKCKSDNKNKSKYTYTNKQNQNKSPIQEPSSSNENNQIDISINKQNKTDETALGNSDGNEKEKRDLEHSTTKLKPKFKNNKNGKRNKYQSYKNEKTKRLKSRNKSKVIMRNKNKIRLKKHHQHKNNFRSNFANGGLVSSSESQSGNESQEGSFVGSQTQNFDLSESQSEGDSGSESLTNSPSERISYNGKRKSKRKKSKKKRKNKKARRRRRKKYEQFLGSFDEENSDHQLNLPKNKKNNSSRSKKRKKSNRKTIKVIKIKGRVVKKIYPFYMKRNLASHQKNQSSNKHTNKDSKNYKINIGRNRNIQKNSGNVNMNRKRNIDHILNSDMIHENIKINKNSQSNHLPNSKIYRNNNHLSSIVIKELELAYEKYYGSFTKKGLNLNNNKLQLIAARTKLSHEQVKKWFDRKLKN